MRVKILGSISRVNRTFLRTLRRDRAWAPSCEVLAIGCVLHFTYTEVLSGQRCTYRVFNLTYMEHIVCLAGIEL